MKLIYKPFGVLIGILAGVLSKKVFEAVWGVFDKDVPPKPTTRETTVPKLTGSAVVQGVTFKVTRSAVDRAAAQGFAHLTGVWPGEKKPEKSQAAEVVR
jgi:hypothetical protein